MKTEIKISLFRFVPLYGFNRSEHAHAVEVAAQPLRTGKSCKKGRAARRPSTQAQRGGHTPVVGDAPAPVCGTPEARHDVCRQREVPAPRGRRQEAGLDSGQTISERQS